MKRNYTDQELKDMMRDILLDNIDKIASAVASKLKTKLKDRSTFVRNEQRLIFVKKYATLCAEAYKEGPNHIYHKYAKKPAGKALVALAREELNYKKTTYGGDIYRLIGITYFKSINQWKH